jgi:HemK-related putative methylase
MGTGSGIIAIFLEMVKSKVKKLDPIIYASDILEQSIKCAKKNEVINYNENRITFIRSDLFKEFPESLKKKFNVIIFNPPYLPSIEDQQISSRNSFDKSWDGGLQGYEKFISFLKAARPYINPNKKNFIYSIYSSKVPIKEFKEKVGEMNFKCEFLDKVHFFFEDISLIRLSYKIKD